jgi:hypothetical protein
MKWISPIILVALGVLLLFAGSTAASAEEGVANSIGSLLTSKWTAFGLIIVGVLIFANDEGLLKKAIAKI